MTESEWGECLQEFSHKKVSAEVPEDLCPRLQKTDLGMKILG